MSHLETTLEQTQELEEREYDGNEITEKEELTEVNITDLIPKGQSSNRKTLTSRQPFLGWTDNKYDYRPPMHNLLSDVGGVKRVEICKDDLKLKVLPPQKPNQTLKPKPFGAYNNPNATPVLEKQHPYYPSQASPFSSY